jgi:spore coat polysaccharide biosynthesis protein SpsF
MKRSSKTDCPPLEADLGFARSVYAALYPSDPQFGMGDVLDLVGGGVDLGRYAA